jgi:hypothetical protein
MSTDTLYRRNEDGMMETVIPEAQGKAAALSSYLAQGGTPFRNSGRFKKGPMKGKNVDEATADFERKWAASPDALKQKYADRSSGRTTDLAPSERKGFETAPVSSGVKITAPKTALTPAPRAPMQTPGVSATVQGPPSPATQTALARRTQPPATPLTPAYSGPRTGLSPLAQGELAKREAAVTATPTGKPVMSEAAAANESVATGGRVNSLTGLPMGYQPGDTLPNGADAAMATRAAQSVKRQEVATSKAAMAPKPAAPKPIIAGITPVPRGPASQPAPTGSALDNPNNAFSKEAYARTAAAEAKGVKRQEELSKAVNVDDPKKFFTGRVLPLDQLVKRQKLQGIGTPAMR